MNDLQRALGFIMCNLGISFCIVLMAGLNFLFAYIVLSIAIVFFLLLGYQFWDVGGIFGW